MARWGDAVAKFQDFGHVWIILSASLSLTPHHQDLLTREPSMLPWRRSIQGCRTAFFRHGFRLYFSTGSTETPEPPKKRRLDVAIVGLPNV
jgi:hypothetical protein